MERLTKLQHLGISLLLMKYASSSTDGRELYKGGRIMFVNNSLGQWTNMYLRIYHEHRINEHETARLFYKEIVMTLEYNENINSNYRYRFEWDSDNMIFAIIDVLEN